MTLLHYITSGLSRSRRRLRVRVRRACAAALEGMESGAMREPIPQLTPPPAAIVEPLEQRAHLSTFDVYVSGQPQATAGSTYSIILYTTGAAVTQYVVYWEGLNGGVSDTYNFNPARTSPFTGASHTYPTGEKGTTKNIVVKATAQGGGTAYGYFGADAGRGSSQLMTPEAGRPSAPTCQHANMPSIRWDDPLMRSVIDLGLVLGIAQQKIAEGLREGTPEPRLAFREEAQRILEILQKPSSRHATQAMISRAIPQREGKPDTAEIDRVVRGYRLVDLPCLIVWGEQDRVLFPQMGRDLANSIPTAYLRYVRRGMHSIPVEHPMASARLIRQLVAGQFDAVERIQRIEPE